MKLKMLTGLLVTATILSCSQSPKVDSMAGVYKMEKQLMNDGVKDYTFLASEGNTQFKIYTPESYFYIAVGKDSSVSFGTGSYTLTDGKVEEQNVFNSGSLDTANTALLEISNKTDKGYTQYIDALEVRGTKYKLTEDYSSLEAKGTSPLDGVWHQIKNLEITGTDTVDATYNEYKVFHAGHFMWAARGLVDSVKNTYKNYVGHGTFSLVDNALTENLDMSSMAGITGRYDISITFNGTDEYTQKTSDTTKSKVVGFKTYKRISK